MKASYFLLFLGLALASAMLAGLHHGAKVEEALNSSVSEDGRMCLYWISPENMFPPDCMTLREYNEITAIEISSWSPEKRAQIEADIVRELRDSGWSETEISNFRARYQRNVTSAL